MSGSASLDLERSLLQHTLAIAPMPVLGRVYVALCLTAPTETASGVEASGGGYSRTPATFALMASPSNAASNASSVEFLAATSAWGTIGYFEIWTAATGGTRLYWGQLLDPADGVPIEMDVAAGDIVRFSAGALVVQAADVTAGGGPWLPLTGGTIHGPVTLAGAPATASGAAIQALIDALPANGGSIMLAANTVYDVTAPIICNKPNTRITAPSWGTILRRNASMTGGAVLTVTGANTTLEGFTVDGNSILSTDETYWEVIANGGNSLVRNIQIINFGGNVALGIDGQNSRATGNTIRGVGISLSTERGQGIWALGGRTVMIDHNIITGVNTSAIGIDGEGSQCIGNYMANCHCYAPSPGGAIYSAAAGHAAVGTALCIVGNFIGRGGSGQAQGIECWIPNTIVSGNVIDDIQLQSILIFANGITVTGNAIRNSGFDAIVATAGISDFVISGNRVADNRTTPVMRYAINVNDGASDRYVITGNLLVPHLTQAIYDGGTGTSKIIANNLIT